MSIVKLLERSEANPSVHSIYDRSAKHFGHVPDLVKAMANNPTMCTSITNFMIQSLDQGRITWKFKELMIIRTLQVMKSVYSVEAHKALAKQLGESGDRINNLGNWKTSTSYSAAEKAVFALIEQIAVDPNDVGDDLWTPLKAHWDNGQLLEITSVITTFLAIGRIGDGLQVNEEKLFSRAVN